MKHLAFNLLWALILSPPAFTQTLPEAPAPPPDPAWARLGNLAIGQPLVIGVSDNRIVHCQFSAITDVYLFCSPAGNPPGVGYRFDRNEVISVELDRTGAAPAQARAPATNYHPGWIASMIAGGLVVGLIASQNTHPGQAAQDGFIGAAAVGLIGAPLAFLPHAHPAPVPGPLYSQFGFGIPFRIRTPRRLPGILTAR